MKCVYCGVDSPYSKRTNGKCSGCNKKFAFEPKKGHAFTDMGFKSAIDAVSAKGRVRWGVEHLYYEVCRRRRGYTYPWMAFLLISVALSVALFALGALAAIFFVLPMFLAIWLLLRSSGRSPTVRFDQQTFDKLWKRWTAAHGEPPGLIVRKPQPQAKKEKEPDIGDYSFDRAVICDRARTVDLLIANNFHFENNCAVLSVGGYPEGPFNTVRAMLKRNPKLQVFVLHDASVGGCRLAHHLANDPQWFKEQVPVTDVGIRPRHSGPFRGLCVAATGAATVAVRDGIVAEEVEFLNTYVLELAAIRPEQILKRLFKAINRREESSSGGGGGGDGGGGSYVHYDNDSFSSDAGDSDGGSDSFG